MGYRDLAIEMIKTIDVTFPNSFNFKTKEDKVRIVKIWTDVLSKYPEPIVTQAFNNAMSRAEFAPKVGTIVNECEKIIEATKKSDEELWSIFSQALNRIDFAVYNLSSWDRKDHLEFIKKVFEELPEEIKEYCSNYGEFIRIQREENMTFLKQKFMARMPQIKERITIKRTMSPELLLMASNIGERLKLA